MHVTCIAHLLHNCAMRVRAFIKNIDDVVATIKAATIINKDRKNDFRQAGLPSPRVSLITRWGTCLRAALYYSGNLPAFRTIANNQTGEGLFAEVESRTLGTKPRSSPRTQKKSEAKDSPSEDRPSRGQGQECSRPRPSTKARTQVFSKKKGLQKIFQAISKKGLQKFFFR